MRQGDNVAVANVIGTDVNHLVEKENLDEIAANEPETLHGVSKPVLSKRQSILRTEKAAAARKHVHFAQGVSIEDEKYSIMDAVELPSRILKIYLENGNTKSFRYDSGTRIQDFIDHLTDKLAISHEEHFAICIQYPTGPRSSQISLLEPEKNVYQVLSEISAQQFHFSLRFAFLPADILALLESDLNAFLYLYQQACLLYRFYPDYATSWVVLDYVQLKEIKKYLKLIIKEERKLAQESAMYNVSARKMSALTRYYYNLRYLSLIRQVDGFLSRRFAAILAGSDVEMEATVRQHSKISFQSVDALKLKSFAIDYEDIASISIGDTNLEQQKILRFQLTEEGASNNECSFLMEKDDAYEFVALIRGYALLLTKRRLNCEALVHRDAEEATETDALHTTVRNDLEEKDISVEEREDQQIPGTSTEQILENAEQTLDEAEDLLRKAPISNLAIQPRKLLMAKDSIRIHNRYLAKTTPLLNEVMMSSMARTLILAFGLREHTVYLKVAKAIEFVEFMNQRWGLKGRTARLPWLQSFDESSEQLKSFLT